MTVNVFAGAICSLVKHLNFTPVKTEVKLLLNVFLFRVDGY